MNLNLHYDSDPVNLGMVRIKDSMPDERVEQACTTYGPRAACGPRMHFVRPAKAFQSRSTNEVCLPSVFRVL